MRLLRHWLDMLIYRRSTWRYAPMRDGVWTFRREKTCRVCGHSFTSHTESLSQGKLREVLD